MTALRVIPADSSGSALSPAKRAYVSPSTLRDSKIPAGAWVQLGAGREIAVVQLWPRGDLGDDSITLAPCYSSKLQGKTVSLALFAPTSARLAASVTIAIASDGNGTSRLELLDKREMEWTKAIVKERLTGMRYLSGEAVLDIGDRSFVIKTFDAAAAKASGPDDITSKVQKLSLENGDGEQQVWEVNWKTKVVLEENESLAAEEPSTDTDEKIKTSKSRGTLAATLPSYINVFTPSTLPASTSTDSDAYALLGGLTPQINLVRTMLTLPMTHPHLFSLFNLPPSRGILLHGPPGTGKTALARAVASSTPDCSCIVVNGPELSSAYHGETEERLRGVFEEARKRSPCIIVLDEVDALCPRRDGDGGEVEKRVVATLLTLMDGMGVDKSDERVFVIAATNRPNSIDPALRRPGRFDREIEIGIPNAEGRREILDILLNRLPHSLTSDQIHALAARTHGFVGADLSSLVREAATLAIQRYHDHPPPQLSSALPSLTQDDILRSLPSIRPSAMREVMLETPTVRWSDIGGQEDVKQKLRECVEWPLKHGETFKRLGVEAPKGVLLYGPPGCSKTLTAKALACESGLNFLAVKGPELLNKFVGESERAVREVFRKARAAAPSIIFFDEIDALGSARADDGVHNGVLTSLLNEMDGIEELAGVTVVAATNRPDVLDSALMRPGRLDRILFVGAPDFATRKDIFRLRLAKMAVEPGGAVSIDDLASMTEGCSGAEIASICQDAAMTAMNEDVDAPYVKNSHLLHSARTVRRRITPEMIRFFDEWRDQSGVRSA